MACEFLYNPVQTVALNAPILFDIVMQKENMSESEREAFVAKFRKSAASANAAASNGLPAGLKKPEDSQIQMPGFGSDTGKKRGKTLPLTKGLAGMKSLPGNPMQSLVGFCVMGGIFSEGIDLTGEDLIGVIVAGGGIPYLTRDRELMREYFDEDGGKGFEYAYMIPGLNKVLQSAGRLIRTEEDEGCILYLEKRFRRPEYDAIFPKHMKPELEVTVSTVTKHMADFWADAGSHRN